MKAETEAGKKYIWKEEKRKNVLKRLHAVKRENGTGVNVLEQLWIFNHLHSCMLL